MNAKRFELMKRLYETTNDTLAGMVSESQIDLDKYLKPTGYKTLNQVYEGALSSLCNRQSMPKNIKFEERRDKFKAILFDFYPSKVAEEWDNNWELLFKILQEKVNPTSRMDLKNPRNQWVIFCKGAVSAAVFFSNFSNKNEFDAFVGSFQSNKYSREALPMLLSHEIFGFGFALACDFLKEAGYTEYAKPDVHLMDVFSQIGLCRNDDYDVFKTVIELAELVKKTPYEVDKKIWLVCSGKFYLDNKEVKAKKKELIQRIINY